MAKPIPTVADIGWAGNTNYGAGPLPGTPTKNEPSAGRKADGWRPADEPDAQDWNWWNHHVADWTRFFYDDMLSPIITDAGVLKDDTVDTSQIVDDAVQRAQVDEGRNLIPNPTAARGNEIWWGYPAVATLTSDDSDIMFRNLPNFEFDDWSGEGNGAYWKLVATGGVVQIDVSDRIVVPAATNLTLSARFTVVGWTTGSGRIDIACFESDGTYISDLCINSFSSNLADWVLLQATGVTPALTAFVRVRKLVASTINAGASVFITQMKLEKGTEATPYSDDVLFDYQENQNLIMNSTARAGNAWWWDGGAFSDYNVPGTDTDQALSYAAANFTPAPWVDATGNGNGPVWRVVPDGSEIMDLSERIDIGKDVFIALAAEVFISNISTGGCGFDIVCFDSSDNFQGLICRTVISVDAIIGHRFAYGKTLANGETDEAGNVATADTDYIRIRKFTNADVGTTLFQLGRMKLEKGKRATPFSDEASMPQYLSARRTTDNGTQTLTTGIALDVIFENPTSDSDVFDDPGADRYDTGTGYFTADRYMKLRVSTSLLLDSAAWNIGRFTIQLYKTPLGGGEGLYANLSRTPVEVAASKAVGGQGGSTIKLNLGDKFRIKAFQDSGSDKTISSLSVNNYLDIEEI